MAQQLINIGQSVNDKRGDPLRTAFDKVNQNFTELFATDTLTKYQLGDDEQFVRIELDGEGVPTGGVTIQSGFDTAMPVYIKGGNALQDGVGGNVVIEAGAPPLAEGLIQDGGPYAGTVGDIEMAANQVTIETLGGVTTFSSGDGTPYVTFPAVNGSQLGIQGSEISSLPGSEGLALSAREGSIILSTHGDQYPSLLWEFDRSGTINTPLLFPKSFTAVLDVEHRTVGSGTYPGPAWEFNLEWQVNTNGEIECLSDNGPLPSPVAGYANGQTFEFTEADHGIPNYTLTIVLRDVDHNPAGYTANLDFSAPPAYPSTVYSEGAIKLTSNGYSLILDPDGTIAFPTGGRIGDISNYGPGLSTGFFDTNGITMGTAPGNDITITPEDGIGIYSNSNLWAFGTDGNLTLPDGGIIKNFDGTEYGGGGGGSSYNQSLNTTDNVTFNRLKIANGLHAPAAGGTYDKIKLYDFADNAKINYAIGTEDHHIWMSVDATSAGFKWYGGTNRALTLTGDGTLTLANGVKVDVGTANKFTLDQSTVNYIDLRDVDGRGYYTDSSGYTLRSNGSYSWIYDSNGILNLPNSSTGEPLIQGTNSIQLNADGSFFTFGADGNLYVPNEIHSTAGVGPVTIQANNGTLRTWTFGTDGKLTLPGSSNAAFIQDADDRMLIANYGTDYWTTLGINSAEGKFDFGIKDTAGSGTIHWIFDKDGSTTLPGDLHGPEKFFDDPFGNPVSLGHTLNITPASNASNKKFGFRIDQTYGSFQRAYLEMPLAETNKQVGLSFPHEGLISGSLFVQGFDHNSTSLNNALNIFANGTNVKITAESIESELFTWTFGTDGTLSFPNTSTFNGNDFVAKENEELNLTIVDSSAYIGVKENNNNINDPAAYMDVYFGKKSRIRTASLDNQTEYDWIFNPDGTLTFPDLTSQTTAFQDVPSHIFFVHPNPGRTFTATGTYNSPFATIAAANAAAVTAGHDDSNPAVIVLMANTIENVTLKPGIFLTSFGTGTHGSPTITGTVTVTSSTGTTVTNHYSISNLRIVAPNNTSNCIYFTGNAPQKLFVRDMWIDAKGTGTGILMDNTGSGSTLQLDIAHIAHSGTGDVYCIDVTKGNCYITDIETTGAVQVAAVRTGCVLTIDSSELDATGDVVCETYGTGSLTITNSIINNTQANGNGIKLNDLGGVATLGNNLISVPVGSGYVVQGITGTVLYAANNVFLTANTARSTAITYVALPTTWSTKS